jgi:hypothetical protein
MKGTDRREERREQTGGKNEGSRQEGRLKGADRREE